MAKDKLWYIPCKLNSASLGDSAKKFATLTDLVDPLTGEKTASRPVWTSNAVVVWPQTLPFGSLKGYVLAKEIDRAKGILRVVVTSNGEEKCFELQRSSVMSPSEFNKRAEVAGRKTVSTRQVAFPLEMP